MANPMLMRRRPEDWSRPKWIRWRYLWFLPTRAELHSARVQLVCRWRHQLCMTIPRDAGAYGHWRCTLIRKHTGSHRYVNYTWAGPGSRVEYDPLPVGRVISDAPDRAYTRLPQVVRVDRDYTLTWPWRWRVVRQWKEARELQRRLSARVRELRNGAERLP